MTENNINSTREYHLDWIRVSVVLLLIPFHAAVSFSHIGKGYIYSSETADSWFFIFLSDYLNLWFMRMLFFISGIATFKGLQKRSNREYIRDRIKRLIIPVIFVVLTIAPISAYILATSHYGFEGSFAAFYPSFFSNVSKYLFWGHMWFCVYLFIFSLMTLPLFSLLKTKPVITEKINTFLIRNNRILLPLLIIVIFEMAFRPFYPGFQSFIGDWANVTVHLSFYIFGFIMGHSKKLFTVITKKMHLFFLIAIISTILYIYLKRFYTVSIDNYSISVILSMLWGIAAYSWVMFYFAFFKRYVNKTNKLLEYLSAGSFSLYIFHYFIISVLNFYLLKTELNNYFVWGITTLLTYIIFVLIYELILKKVKPLKQVCGIK